MKNNPFIYATVLLLCISLANAKAKNVILMISDGCGKEQIRATNLHLHGKPDGMQTYEKFPLAVFMSTYSAQGHGYDGEKAKQDKTYVHLKPTDSASSGTALATGVKTYDRAIGMDVDSIPLVNITQRASQIGKSAGVVSSVQISHATPASMVAHNVFRDNYSQIAQEMFTMTSMDVIMGAGHPEFNDDNQKDSVQEYKYVGGQKVWNNLKNGKLNNIEGSWSFVESKGAFDSLANSMGSLPQRVVGVAQVRTTLQMRRSGADAQDYPFADPLNAGVPDLATMSKGALNVLNQNAQGFFLMIEGGAVDWAGHDNLGGRLIEEQIDFNRAVDSVVQWINRNGGWDNNLLIVTADHETGGLEMGKIKGPPSVRSAMKWGSKKHTNQLVPFYAKGNGVESLRALAKLKDPQRGVYLDNALVGKWLNDWAMK